MKKKSKKSVRLASHIRPERYTLTLKPDLEAFTFSGKEVIDILLDKPASEITLHSKDIKIDTVEIVRGSASHKTNFASKISYDIKAETTTFKFKNKINIGKAKLSIVFEGVINEHLRGFYRSKYEIDGVTKHLATTQFEATDARRAFPCFDEPAQKAIFDVSLIIPNHHTAISNTLPTSTLEHESGYKVVEFSSTPRMSTYLLAFIIGEFEFIEGYTKDKVKVRVFTTKGKKHQAKFALGVAIKSLEFYNKYFDIPYPLPILDMIAIPDFESGAMENWGAVTYRETAILVDEEHSSLSNKQWVALVIAHELAHQWFGNLVTMEWWTDLWLNEGFASYIEYLAVDHIFPDWRIWDQFLTSDMAGALRLDALKHSHPIEVTVHHPNEINEIFDTVSYAKGASVIKMLASYIGEDAFRFGLQHYLKKHSYKNTETVDLWHSFEKVSKKPVAKIMQNWTRETGYPFLSLQKKKNTYSVIQERFFSSRISARTNKERTLWHIPFTYESNNDTLRTLLTKHSAPLMGTSIGKVNKGEHSLIRVQYDKDTLDHLRKQIEDGLMPVHDRLGIIRDLFALAESGHVSTIDVLEFSLSYKNETEYIVWAELSSGINKIRHIIGTEAWVKKYDAYALSLFSPLAKKLSWKKNVGEDHARTFLRSLALSNAGLYGDKNVIKEAQRVFKNKDVIEADLRSIVYTIVARNGGSKEWKQFEKLYKEEKLQEQQDRYGRALAQFKDKKLISRTLQFALSKNVRAQDAAHMIVSQWQNTYGRDLTWQFLKKNWATILKRYGEGGHFLGRLLSPLGGHIKTRDAIDAKNFFKKNLAPGAERTLEQAYERIYSNAAWLKADKASIKKWLEKNYNK